MENPSEVEGFFLSFENILTNTLNIYYYNMSLEQHTSIDGALTLAPKLFFQTIGTTDALEQCLGNLYEIYARRDHYLSRARELLDKPRTGWTREKRKIPKELWETIGAHMVKVGILAHKIPDGLLKWHIRRGEVPSAELVKIYFDTNAQVRIARKWFFHDFQEWWENPDLTPGEETKEEQDRIEYEAMLEYARLFGDWFPLEMYESMREKNLENVMVFNLDKMDAAVMALNYEREVPGCDVSEFFPYTFRKLSFPMMQEILATLIEHKNDYPNDYLVQYDSLLFHGGNRDAWRYEMDLRAKHWVAWELFAKLERFKRRWWED